MAGPVDWALAQRVAHRVAGRDALGSSYLADSLEHDFAAVSVEAEGLVTELTGLAAPGPARAGVLDRNGWIDANVTSLSRLLAPLTDRVAERMGQSPLTSVSRTVAGTEAGVLLGYMARRVLGQYDVLVPESPDAGADSAIGDRVYYVGPNVLALEKRFAFRPRDFRLWIAIHELTHRAQFTGVPWMRSYFRSLVDQVLSLAEPDPRRVAAALGRAVEEVRAGRNPLDDGLVGLLATAEQRVVLARVQALMSLLEGHGNAVMNRLGAEHVEGQDRMARVLHARRAARGVTGVVQKLLGLELKLRQYEVGEAFVDAVEREAGFSALDAAWRGPEWLPTMDELTSPLGWLQRVEATSPTH